MGNEAAKAIVPLVMQGLPQVIRAIRGDDNSSSGGRTQENRRVLEILEEMQRNRHDMDRILQNQQQLMEAYMLLGQRIQEGGGNLQLQNGTGNQHSDGTNGRGRLRIDMELPEDAEEREEALRRFWKTLASQAAAFTSENGDKSAPSDGSKNGSERGGRPALAASAPPGGFDDSSQELSKLDSFLYCEICTQRYNTTDRRPTLLPMCGHTFCKECLCKANRRNHKCPHCRQITNVNVDQHPTNFAILDFLKESEEDSKSKTKKEELDFDTPDLTYEEQIEIARQLSLELSQSQQIGQEERNRQEEEDRRVALELQREEERLMAFRFHEEVSEKARNMNDRYEYMNSHRDHDGRVRGGHYPVFPEESHIGDRGGHYPVLPEESHIGDRGGHYPVLPEESHIGDRGGHYPGLPEESHIGDRDGNVSDDDVYDACHAALRPNRVNHRDVYIEMEEVDDGKKSRDSEDDRHLGSPVGNSYDGAHHSLSDLDDAKNCSDSDDECLKPGKKQKGHDETLLGDDGCGESRRPNESIPESRSLYQAEQEWMLLRAEDTRKQDKERRRKNKRLKEQEEIDLALALSLSLSETQVVPASSN